MFPQEEQKFISIPASCPTLKFIRREDITPELRLYIASVALYFNEYGKISELSKDYQISRTFIYQLRTQLLAYGWIIFGLTNFTLVRDTQERKELESRIALIRAILVLRMEGKCPLQGISTILIRRGFKSSSLGYISELLTDIGHQLPNTIDLSHGMTYSLVFASDEVFSQNRPVLITVDPVSSAILRIDLSTDRTQQSWERHWQGLLDKQIIPLYINTDEGTGMKAAKETTLKDTTAQPDTFHAVALRLGDICRILKNKVYKAIEEEGERERVMNNAKSESVKNTKTELYQQAQTQTNRLIALYEDYCFWYQLAIEQFQIFNEQGKVRDSQQAQQYLNLALEELQNLEWKACRLEKKLTKVKKEVKTIQNLVAELFYFLQYAQNILQPFLQQAHCQKHRQAIYLLCKAFQHHKNEIKAKNSKVKKYHHTKEEEYILQAYILFEEFNWQEVFSDYAQQLYEKLDGIVQSSAMVETINSIVRTYFNVAKNQITQAQLNLIMFYHNHRKYKQGKRKGFAPIELLTARKLEQDWLDILIQKLNL